MKNELFSNLIHQFWSQYSICFQYCFKFIYFLAETLKHMYVFHQVFLSVEIQSKFLVCSKQNMCYYFSRIIVDFIRTDCVYGECSKSALRTLFNILVRSTYDRAVPQFAYSFVHSRSNLMQMNSKHPIYMKNWQNSWSTTTKPLSVTDQT